MAESPKGKFKKPVKVPSEKGSLVYNVNTHSESANYYRVAKNRSPSLSSETSISSLIASVKHRSLSNSRFMSQFNSPKTSKRSRPIFLDEVNPRKYISPSKLMWDRLDTASAEATPVMRKNLSFSNLSRVKATHQQSKLPIKLNLNYSEHNPSYHRNRRNRTKATEHTLTHAHTTIINQSGENHTEGDHLFPSPSKAVAERVLITSQEDFFNMPRDTKIARKWLGRSQNRSVSELRVVPDSVTDDSLSSHHTESHGGSEGIRSINFMKDGRKPLTKEQLLPKLHKFCRDRNRSLILRRVPGIGTNVDGCPDLSRDNSEPDLQTLKKSSNRHRKSRTMVKTRNILKHYGEDFNVEMEAFPYSDDMSRINKHFQHLVRRKGFEISRKKVEGYSFSECHYGEGKDPISQYLRRETAKLKEEIENGDIEMSPEMVKIAAKDSEQNPVKRLSRRKSKLPRVSTSITVKSVQISPNDDDAIEFEIKNREMGKPEVLIEMEEEEERKRKAEEVLPRIGDLVGQFFQAINFGDLDTIKMMLEKFPEVLHGQDASIGSGLHLAVKRNNFELCEFLLEQGIDLRRKDFQNRSARELALQKRHNKIFRYLRRKEQEIEEIEEAERKRLEEQEEARKLREQREKHGYYYPPDFETEDSPFISESIENEDEEKRAKSVTFFDPKTKDDTITEIVQEDPAEDRVETEQK